MDSIKLNKIRQLAIPMAIVFAVIDVVATVLTYVSNETIIQTIASILFMVATGVMIVLYLFAFKISKGTTAARAFKFIITGSGIQIGAFILNTIYIFAPGDLIGLVFSFLLVISGIYSIMGFINLYRSMRYDPNFHKDNYLRVFVWTTVICILVEITFETSLELLTTFMELGSAIVIINYVFIALVVIGEIIAQIMLALYIRNYVPDPSVAPYEDRGSRYHSYGVREDGYRDDGYSYGGRDTYTTTTDDPFDLGGGEESSSESSEDTSSSSSSSDPFDDDLFN